MKSRSGTILMASDLLLDTLFLSTIFQIVLWLLPSSVAISAQVMFCSEYSLHIFRSVKVYPSSSFVSCLGRGAGLDVKPLPGSSDGGRISEFTLDEARAGTIPFPLPALVNGV